MATGETKQITGSLTLDDKYQTTIYDDILEIIGATITLNDPAGEIFTDKGNDTVTVSNSTIINNSETGAELMFSMGSGDDSLDISNTTLNVNTFMGSGNDTVTVAGSISSYVTINKQFSLGAGDDTLTLKSTLMGIGNLVFGDGNDTLVFDGGHLMTTGSITGLTNLTVTGNSGTLGNNLTLSGSQNAITLNGNLTGTDSYKVITVSDSTVTFKTANNVKTNVVYSVSNVIFNHVDGGTLEIAESSYWAFSADYSTVTLHDTVLRSNGGGFYGTETDWIISNSDISNNTNGVNLTNGSLDLTAVGFSNNNNTALKLSGTALTGKDVSFTSNANGALDILHANAVLDDARFAKNHTDASCISTSRVSASVSAFGGAIRQTAGNMILNNSYFSGNSANVDVIASNSASAYSFSYASASAYAFATATATVYGGAIANSSGDLIFSGSANYFSDNSANANVIAKAYAIASVSVGPYDNGIASAYAFVSATATATAYGGAIANSSGDLIFSSSANYFSGNSANAKIIAQAIPNARSSGYVYSYPTCIQNSRAFATATATAYGGAIANCSGDLIFSGSANYFSDNCANANVIAVASGFATAIAYGGAIAHSDGVLKLNKASFDGNYANVSATAAVRDTAAVRGKAYGGAIAANNSILNLTDVTFSANSANATAYGSPSSVVSAYSTASVTAYGGAVYISNSTMEYVVTENECIENIGNNAQKGGFIYLDGVSEATFKVDGSLIVGDSTGMDSIAGSETSTIIKTGSGKWTVNSDISEFTGYWNLNEGILKLDRIARDITLDNWTIGVDAELQLSALNDTISMNVDKKIGTIDLGGGSDTINTGGYHLSDGLLKISTLTLTGGGRVSSEITNRTVGSGFDLILDDITLNSIITGGNAADKITVTQSSTIGGVLNLGNGANTITANSGTETVFVKSVMLGTGADTLTFSSVVFQDSLTLGSGKNSFSAEDSAKIAGAFTAGNGDDTLSFGSVEFGNSADLGDGVNSLTATGNAKFSDTLNTGNGSDTLTFASVTFNKAVSLGDGNNKLTANTAVFNGNLTAGSGNDTINLKQNSELHGNIALGGGRNYIYVTQNLTITDGFTLDSDGETHLIVYNNASLSSNSLNVYDPENSNMVSVTYDWSAVEGLDKVRLLVSSDATFETFEFTVELYNQSKEFTLNVSDNYFIQFQAQDEDGWSHRILEDTEAPDQVTGFAMDGTTALWSDTHDNWGGNGVKQYNIQVASDANFNSVIGSFTATDNSYDFSSFADGNYFIRIQAEDYTGNKGDWSDAENLLIDNNAPTKPANVTGKVSLDSITVNWSPASDSGSGLKEYKIEFSTSSTFSSITHSATLSGTSYTASDLADGTYYFRGSAVDNVNNVSAWSTVSSVIVDTTAPQAASNVKATQNSGIVTLSWDAASDAGVGVKEYIVEYSTDNSFSSIAGTRTVSGTSCSINGLADGNYCFRVQAVDKNGNAASWSNTATVIVDSVPPAKPTASADITSATNKDVTVSAVFSSDSVVKEYSLDNRNWYAYSSGVVMSNNGTVYFRGKDEAGNYSAVTSYKVTNIDKVAPAKPEVFASTTAPTNKNVTVSAEFSLDSIKQQFSYDNQTWYDYESGIVLSRNGVLYFRGIDAVGNVSEVAEYTVDNIDKIAPSAPSAFADVTTLTNNPVTVSAAFSNDSDRKQYSFDGYTWSSYTSGVVMESNGIVYFRSFDAAGNVSEIAEYVVENIDNIAPAKPTATADITAETEDVVTITATFSRDSVVKQYSLDNKNWQTYTSGIVMECNGTVYFRGIDAAGTISAVTAYEVNNIIAVSDVIADDLDGNGLADTILVHTKQGYSGAWLTTGTTSVIKWGSLSNVNAGTEILGTGRLYGSENDGQDIFFADSKSVGAWNVVDGKVTGYKSIMSVNSTTNVLGLGDFNGDGATDILLRSTNGDLGFYNTDGTGFTYLKGLGKEWTVAAIGDLNGDGLDDTVLRHDAGFAGTFLTQENGTVKWASLDTLKSDMDIIGTGDFNGDGMDDVLLQNKSNGWVGAWLVEEGRVDSFIGLCTNKNTIEQIADFNGDGIDDLRVRAGADIGVLYVNGADDTTWQYFKSVGKEWDTSFSALA